MREASVSFGRVKALRGATLEVGAGERVAVIGASGAGKSTLFKLLTRSVALGGGEVFVGGLDLYGLPRRQLKAVRSRVGVVHQGYNLVPQLSTGMNAALGEIGDLGGWRTLRTLLIGPDAALSERVARALEQVGLSEKMGARTADLSGGQQQRVAVSRLLVQRPDLILADEPFAAVDPVTAEKVVGVLEQLNREGATLLVNLHDVQRARRFPRVVALREGRVVFDGAPEALSEEMLAEVYGGEKPGAPPRDPDEAEEADAVRHCRQEPTRLPRGIDGISAH